MSGGHCTVVSNCHRANSVMSLPKRPREEVLKTPSPDIPKNLRCETDWIDCDFNESMYLLPF